MLGIMFAELVALLDECLRRGLDLFSGSPLALLMWLLVVLFMLQGLGLVFVMTRRYRIGGVLQMVASGCHVPDLFGLIGVAGGWKAYHYPARALECQKSGAAEPGNSNPQCSKA